MVLAGLAFQPERWAAGVDTVGISSLVTFLENTSSYRRAHREQEYGSLERDREFLERASPLNRIDDVHAPLFVIHGANDPRVPFSEAQQVASAVRANGIACELVVYDDEGHGLAKRVNRLDAYPGRWPSCGTHWPRDLRPALTGRSPDARAERIGWGGPRAGEAEPSLDAPSHDPPARAGAQRRHRGGPRRRRPRARPPSRPSRRRHHDPRLDRRAAAVGPPGVARPLRAVGPPHAGAVRPHLHRP